MRSELEIQRAHDLLIGIALGDAQVPLTLEMRLILHASADALCWALEHDHNPNFENVLQELEALAKHRGFALIPGQAACAKGTPS
jgi:hypothetical protein